MPDKPGAERLEADLHRFSIGAVLHQQYGAMQEEYQHFLGLNIKMQYTAMAALSGMARAQARPYPELLKQYDEGVNALNVKYGNVTQRGWDMRPVEAGERKELLENLLVDLGPSRIDERPQAPKYRTYDENYGTDGRQLVWELFRARLKENRNFVILFTGQVGGGKSYASLSIADYLTPSMKVGFDLEGLVFDIPDFINRVRSGKAGDVIILDEIGISAGSRDALTKTSKTLSKVVQSVRYLQYCTIFTIPNANFLDRQIRLMVDIVFDHPESSKQGEFDVKIPQLSEDGSDVEFKPLLHGGRIIRTAFFPLPRPKLVEDYETVRREHNMQQLRDLRDALDGKKNDEGDMRGKNPSSRKNLRQYREDEE